MRTTIKWLLRETADYVADTLQVMDHAREEYLYM